MVCPVQQGCIAAVRRCPGSDAVKLGLVCACQQAGVTGMAVGDAPVAYAMGRAFEVLKLVLEPSGAVALAVVLAGLLPVKGRCVLIIASGGNIAFDRFAQCVSPAIGTA
jgi:threonine dehydratase